MEFGDFSTRRFPAMDVAQAIHTKRAVRQFTNDPLPDVVTIAILNAGRRSQSSKNTQPWHFIAITDKSMLKSLAETGTYAGHIAGAALAIAILTPDPTARFSIMFDAGQSAAYMQLAAWELGIGSCLASIYEPEQARQLLGFPEELHLRIALSFGFPLEPDVLQRPPKKGGRRTFSEVVHWEHW
jgi:nitroreductase